MKTINILVIDSTFLGKEPNREKTTFHIKYWVKKYSAIVYIYSTEYGQLFYQKQFSDNEISNIHFINIPFSKDYKNIHLLLIPLEYLKRIIGAFTVKLSDKIDVSYSVTSIIVDILSSIIIRFRYRNIKAFCSYDNFVPKPTERPGKFIYKLIPYLAFKVTLKCIKSMDGIFSALTDENHNKLKAYLNNKQNIIQTPNGLDLELINKIEGSAKKEYDLVYLGRIHIAKGIFDLLNLSLLLKNYKSDISLLIIGPSGDESIMAKVHKFIIDNNLQNNIIFAGLVSKEEKYRLLKSSKLFVFFSYDESFPISFLEAIACRLPIVAYDLEIYKDPPYSKSYHRLYPKGNYNEAIKYSLDILINCKKLIPEIIEFYSDKNLIKSEEEIAESEFNAFQLLL